MTTYISTRFTCRLYLHLTLYVKAMAHLLADEVGKTLASWSQELSQEAEVDIQRLATEEDRLYLLMAFPRQRSVSEVVVALQRASARLLRRRFPARFGEVTAIWERGYAARTAGIPYLPLRALAPAVAWQPPSELESIAQFQPAGPRDLKAIAKICAQPDVKWRN